VIVDTHIYCFRAPDHAAGHATPADHLKFWQWGYAGHHQPSYSTRDRRPGNSSLLMDPAPGDPWRIADRNFRVDHAANRMVWTVDGEDFTKHYLPPQTVEWSAAACIGEMDYAGIDWALNHVDQALDRDNEFFAECVRAYPDRLKSMAIVDEPLIPTDPDRALEGARHAIEDLGLHALKIIPEYAYRIAGSTSFDEPSWRPFWDQATQLGVPIFFSLVAGRTAREVRQGFIDELWTVRRWSERYPDQKVSVTHGFPWRAFVEGDGFALTPQMWEPFKDSRIHLEVSMPIRIGDIFEYPWRETWPVHEAMVRNIGADRLMYGTDMPFQNRFCTYRQSREFIERHLPAIIGQDAVDGIMGGTAGAFLGDPPGAIAGPKPGTPEATGVSV
jgi:predicted TIM-barrel fold metal-dependent hydrolase